MNLHEGISAGKHIPEDMHDTGFNRKKEDFLSGLKSLNPEQAKQAISDVIKEAPQEVKTETVKETIQSLNPEQAKQAISDVIKEAPQEVKTETARKAFKSLDADQAKDFVDFAANTSNQDMNTYAAKKALDSLNSSRQQEVLMGFPPLPPPSSTSVDKIWLIVVISFACVLILSVISLDYSIVWPRPSTGGNLQMLLTIFTAIVGFFGGLMAPSPGRSSQSSQ